MNYKCNPCNISFSSDILYQAHLYSSSHETTVKNTQKRGANVEISDECKCSSYIQKDAYGHITCTLCKAPLNSYFQVQTHFLGQKHCKHLPSSCRNSTSICTDKAVAAYKNISRTVQVSSVENLNAESIASLCVECRCSAYIQKNCTGTYLMCTLCQATLNSFLQVQNHVWGEKHRKLLPWSCKSSGTIRKDCEDKTLAACKNFSQTVRASDIESQSLSAECKCSTYILKYKDGYICTLCKVPLNSFEQVRMHVTGQKHLKLLPCKCSRDKTLAACQNIYNAAQVSNIDTVEIFPTTLSSYDVPDENILSKVKFFNVDEEVCF